MFQVLIAEDSKPILRNIKALLQDSGLPLQAAAGAANGEEALEICRKQPIDILITDIRMPKMDGLTLIDQAKRLNPRLKVVLISGYNDFEYTRKAINLQVCDYLLKPVERSQLVEVMERITAQLKEEREASSSVLDGILERTNGQPFLLEPSFYEQPKLLWVVRRPPFTPPVPWETEAVNQGLAEAFAGQPYWLFPTQDPRQLLLLTNPSFLGGRYTALDRLKELHRLFWSMGFPVSIACCPHPVELPRIPDQYRDLSRQLREHIPLHKPLLWDSSFPLHRIPAVREQMDRLADSYAAMIQKLQKERFLLHLAGELNKWEGADLAAAELERFLYRLAGAFETFAVQHTGRSDRDYTEAFRILLELPGYADFRHRLLALSGECFDELQSHNRKSGNELFEKIDEHLRSNLYAQVTMGDLSDKFHVSSSYISRVVKRYSQNTFVSYYLELKIREARRLMETNPEMKIKEISDALCFHDQHYFSKVFKEYAGCSPSEYKAALAAREQMEQ